MRFAFETTDERDGRSGEPAGDHDPGADAPPHDAAPAAPNGRLEPAAALALYEEYLNELDKVPTLRDPVVAETSGPHFKLEEKIREIVRDELGRLGGGDPPKRGSRSRKRRKR